MPQTITRYTIFKKVVYICTDYHPNDTQVIRENVVSVIFDCGTRLLILSTDRGNKVFDLKDKTFTIINHVDFWWAAGAPNEQVEKGDLPK